MITPKIKALFQFIEYLHSNIENFKQYDELLIEVNSLIAEREKLSPEKNFADNLKYKEIQLVINNKSKAINENIIKPLLTKAKELNIWDGKDGDSLYNWNKSEISQLRENSSIEDLPEIIEHKNKYIEFRLKTQSNYRQTFFFLALDETLKYLFSYFTEAEHNEFEAFETKNVEVNSYAEFVEVLNNRATPKKQQDSPGTSTPQPVIKQAPELLEKKEREFIANEYALAYIFDLWADNKQIPLRDIDDRYNVKVIERAGRETYRYPKQPNTFFKAVYRLKGYDLNKTEDLRAISKDWLNAIRTLSINWDKTRKYLITIGLIGD